MWLPFLLIMLVVLAILGFGAWLLMLAVSVVVGIGVKLLPVLMIAAGIWLLWQALTDRRPRHQRHAVRRGRHQPAPPVSQDVRQAGRPPGHQPRQQDAAARPATPTRRELPIDVRIKAEQIQRKADVLLGYADRFPPFSQSLHIVRQTAADYLPRTLDAYLALPGNTDPVVPTTGQTALAELRAQLQLLDQKLDDITLDLQQQDLDRMSANRRFLEERFGTAEPTDESRSAVPAEKIADQATARITAA